MNDVIIPFGPTYDEMLNPQNIDRDVRERALAALATDELNPVNLFNITWKDENSNVRKVVLPKELTGVDPNIVVLLGNGFPSGSHKVGPAYTTLIEGCADGDILPGVHTILGPSTGNFGIGVSYICKLMGFKAVIIMPDNMSKERYERIKKYGATLDLTPGTESDVILTLKRTYELKKDPLSRSLAQFELFPNYRFHRHVTGHSAIEAVADTGNGRIAAFCSAPGSAGTLAAGDAIKSVFPECRIAALEPDECSTLSNGGRGQHRIEGIGDKMCTLIHNVLNTDYIIRIHDDDCVKGLKVIQDSPETLVKMGVAGETAQSLRNILGISGICNILGAIKMAKHLRLGPDENIVTIATDGFDRYGSVIEDLDRRQPAIGSLVFERWAEEIFHRASDENIIDSTKMENKEHMFRQKENDWLPFGYQKDYLDSMRHMDFWDQEYSKTFEYDRKIKMMR